MSTDNCEQRIEDIKHTMSLFETELLELIETYIHPWIKDEIEDKEDKARLKTELDILGKWYYGEENNTM